MKITHEIDKTIIDGENCFLLQNNNKVKAGISIKGTPSKNQHLTIMDFHICGYNTKKEALLKHLDYHKYNKLRKFFIKLFL